MKFTIKSSLLVVASLQTLLITGCGGQIPPDPYAASDIGLEEIVANIDDAGTKLDSDVNDGNTEPEVIEDLLYEIVEREPDGTTVVQVELVEFREETRSRTVVRDGETVEQVYVVVTPVTELVTVQVPPGRAVLEYLDQHFDSVEEVPEMAPSVLPMPAAARVPPGF